LITRIIFGDEYRSLCSSLCSLLHSPVASSLLGPNILLSTLFSNTLSLWSSFSVKEQVSHPYKTNSQQNASKFFKVQIGIVDLGKRTQKSKLPMKLRYCSSYCFWWRSDSSTQHNVTCHNKVTASSPHSFLSEAEWTPGLLNAGTWNVPMDPNGNRALNLLACGVVTQPTGPPSPSVPVDSHRAPTEYKCQILSTEPK
jgi:hypothetical protein